MARAVRSQVNSAARRRPASRRRSAYGRVLEQPLDRVGDRPRRVRVEERRRVARHLGHRADIRAGHRHAAPHRLEHRQTEALGKRRKHERGSGGVEAFELGGIRPTREAGVRVESERPGALAQLPFVRRRVAGHHEHGPALRRHECERLEQRNQVLVRALGRHREQDRLPTDRVTRAQLRLGQGHGGRGGAHAERDHVDALGAQAEQLHELIVDRPRVGEHALAAPCGERDERPHTEPEHPEVGLGDGAVVQVMDGGHATETPHAGARRREAVHQVHAGCRGPAGEERLLSAHPLDAVGGANRHHDGRDERAPGRVAGARRLPAHERGELQLGHRGNEGGDQLAGVGLGASRLARHEVDQVQPNMKTGRGFASGRHGGHYRSRTRA